MIDEKKSLAVALADKVARTIILEKIKASKDETLGKGKFWRSASYMHEIHFADLMDILLYYMSLQPDLSAFAAKIKADSFLWQTVQEHWKKRGRKLFPFIRSFPWANGPGPMDGSAGPAEGYLLRVGFYDKTLLEWFLYPEILAKESERNWPKRKKQIEGMLFPKLRRKYNTKKLDVALAFAEEICEIMRQKAKQKNEEAKKQ